VTVVPSSLLKLILAAISLGTYMLSFLSPNRYIVELFVFSARVSVCALPASFSALDLKEGLWAYILSWNFWSEPVGPSCDRVPHDDSMTMAAKVISKLFFIVFLYYFNNNSYLRNLNCYAITVPVFYPQQNCAFNYNYRDKINKKQKIQWQKK
jgi:hypothetical protein